MKLRVRPEAQQDILQAAQWYEDRQGGLGEAFVAETSAVMRRIEHGPERFRIVRPAVRVGLAQRFPYAVYFVTTAEEVVVLAVLHQRRDASVVDDRSET